MTGFGFFLILYALGKVITNYHDLATLHNLREFVLPPLLTLAYIPFLYFFALIMAYEMLFMRLGIFVKDKRLLAFTKWRIFSLCHLDLRLLNKFAQNTGGQIVKLKNKQGVLNMINGFRKS